MSFDGLEKHKKCTKLKIAKEEKKSGLTAFEMTIENTKICEEKKKSVKLPSRKFALRLYKTFRLHVRETLTTIFFLRKEFKVKTFEEEIHVTIEKGSKNLNYRRLHSCISLKCFLVDDFHVKQ